MQRDSEPAPARLALEDGTILHGQAIGARREVDGEVVFNTAMTGYQEILTDPSYAGQMVAMTYPLIGNYGINRDDMEAARPHLRALIVRELCRQPSNCRATGDVDSFLVAHGVAGIEGIDTRALTLRLRQNGSQRGYLSTDGALPATELVTRARAAAGVVGMDFVREVATRERYTWRQGFGSFAPTLDSSGVRHRVVAVDYGIKSNILRALVTVGCDVEVVPPTASAAEILALGPHGVFLSNGPGDPAALDYAVAAVAGLFGRVPIFGICLGHQLLGRAAGGTTFKLPFGHHGGNHPVKDLTTGKIEITSQNHGFAVDPESLPGGARVTHLNLYDHTCEGVTYDEAGAFSVQYHPEAAPGPHDSLYLFQRFIDLMRSRSS